MQGIIFMTTFLIYSGVARICGVDILDIPSHTVIFICGLFVSIFMPIIFSKTIRRILDSADYRETYDQKRQSLFLKFLLFCSIYVVIDGALFFMQADTIFVPITVIAGNLLILTLIISFFYHSSRIGMQEQLEKEYQRLEAEKALQSWQEQKILTMAKRDPLTGAYSRRYVMEQIESLKKQAAPYAVIYIDIDGMKTINDQQGHAAGDRYLKSFVKDFNGCLPENAFFSRMGGDEFVSIFPGSTKQEATEYMEHISEKLDQYAFSFGTADTASGAEDVITRADISMYKAKNRKKRGGI